jgi:hypothetical protein
MAAKSPQTAPSAQAKTVSPPIAQAPQGQVVFPDLAEVGDATILVWENLSRAKPIIQTRRIGSDGTLGHVRSWSTIPDPPGPGPEVTLDGDANGAVAVWHNGRRATGAIQARRIAPNGGLGPILSLSPRGNRLESPEVAVGAGTATAVWTGSHRVQARHFRYR